MDTIRRLREWLGEWVDWDANTWEINITRLWVLEMTTALNIAALILLLRLIFNQRSRRSRMIRASALIMLCFAMIMDRFFVVTYVRHGAGIPQPYALILWTFWGLCATYFLYAMVVEWVVPFLFSVWDWSTTGRFRMRFRKRGTDAESL